MMHHSIIDFPMTLFDWWIANGLFIFISTAIQSAGSFFGNDGCFIGPFRTEAHLYVISDKVFVQLKNFSVVFGGRKKLTYTKKGIKEKEQGVTSAYHAICWPTIFLYQHFQANIWWKFEKSVEIFMNHSCYDETCVVFRSVDRLIERK